MMTTPSSNRTIFEGQNSPTRGKLYSNSIYQKLVEDNLSVDGRLRNGSGCDDCILGREIFWGIEDLPDLTHEFVAGEGLLKKRIVRSQHVVASVCVIRIA
jgi:hypothetical protein